ncbi:MAG: J domain-containing protein [Candidatus Eisenbacteria bacterium]|uniref:J domain-containing protein n=1 Tax=Eiseniibacteriota bacterium TaxID=2212470 RepID=A0A849SPK4_UNCEI|nr:J domain-containing protein [Candidatus Eisenbacteria bacterium]
MAVKFRDYYEVLGVARTATPEEIKRAFRRIAREQHPDLKPPEERAQAAEAFKLINEAHEVLKDPAKRSRYDALGSNWKNGQEYAPPDGAAWRTGDSSDWADVGDFSDFFAAVFGASNGRVRSGRPGRAARGPRKGADVEAELVLGVEDLFSGGKRRLSIEGGHSLDVEIPAGVRDGTSIRLAGQGSPGSGGGPPGDLFLRVRIRPHDRFRVNGDDVELDLTLAPWQGALGDEVRLQTPDGAVALKIPEGTSSGRRLRLRERGLPRSGGTRGDLYVVVRLAVSERLSASEREAYESLRRAARAPESSDDATS